VSVDNGANQAFSINPNQNYHILDVQVDGTSMGAVSTYTFTGVTQDHTITASFALDNQPPVANAGADQSVLVNDSVTLDGSGSSDADGDSLSFSWSFVSKPNGSSATLSDTTATTPSFLVDAAGDYVLQEIANRIDAQIRASDVAARYGGEEFVVLLPDTNLESGIKLAERVRKAVSALPYELPGGKQECITASIGIAGTMPDADAEDLKTLGEALIAHADVALYQAKADGRDRIAVDGNK